MYPIHGIVEAYNLDLLSSRDQMLNQRFSGLGPPDLVVLTKKTSDYQEQFYHHEIGLQISDPSSFPAIFASIASMEFGNSKFSISDGLCCCWNSFVNVDIRIKVSNPGSCSFYPYFPPKSFSNFEVNENTWRQLSICSVLRFWRASLPLFSQLFDTKLVVPPAYTFRVPPTLSLDDIRYALFNHQSSSEFEVAITHALIVSSTSKNFIPFIREIAPHFPRILVRLFYYFPPRSPLFTELYEILQNTLIHASDDIIFANTFIHTNISVGNLEKCYAVVPLLEASLWSDPFSGLSLAALSSALDRPEDALLFLNTSCLSLSPSWSSSIPTLPKVPHTKPKDMKKNLMSKLEEKMMIVQLSGANFVLYRTIANLATDQGVIKFQTLISRLGSKRIDATRLILIPRTFDLYRPTDFPQELKKTKTEKKHHRHKSETKISKESDKNKDKEKSRLKLNKRINSDISLTKPHKSKLNESPKLNEKSSKSKKHKSKHKTKSESDDCHATTKFEYKLPKKSSSTSNLLLNLPKIGIHPSKSYSPLQNNNVFEIVQNSPLKGKKHHRSKTISHILKPHFILSKKDKISESDLKNDKSCSSEILKINESSVNNENSLKPLASQYLYNPGMEKEPTISNTVRNLPLAQQLIDCAQLVLHDISTAENLKRNGIPSDTEAALEAAFLGLRLGDFTLTEMALKKAGNSPIAQLMQMRFMIETQWINFEKVFTPESKNTTFNEHNAITLAKTLSEGLNRVVCN